MKKGLRLRPAVNNEPSVSSNADLMKKGLRRKLKILNDLDSSNADLMKKGLRRRSCHRGSRSMSFKRGPDEEGIETAILPPRITLHVLFKRGPDEEGIETNCQPSGPIFLGRSNADLMKKALRRAGMPLTMRPPARSNADLMKKGLRRICRQWKRTDRFKRGPDEEGIETASPGSQIRSDRCSNADLMKKGLRRFSISLFISLFVQTRT